MASANEECGSNEPLTFEKNRLYLHATADRETFMSTNMSDPDGARDGMGTSSQGTIIGNVPDLPLVGSQGVEDVFTYIPVPEYGVKMDNSKDVLVHLEMSCNGPNLGLIPVPVPELPIPLTGQVKFTITITYAEKELVKQDFTQDVNGEDYPIELKFKMPSDCPTFGDGGAFVLSAKYAGGYGTAGTGTKLKGASYIEFPVLASASLANAASNASQTENGTDINAAEKNNGSADSSINELDQTISTEMEKKSPGFEFLGLICAVSVAVFLVRRKR
jgi:hypothetical protein